MLADELHDHIASARNRSAKETRRLTSRMVARCWPGGAEDRCVPTALTWLRRWRPAKLDAKLPDCSCRFGRCPVCN